MSWLYGIGTGLAKSASEIAEGKRKARETAFQEQQKRVYSDIAQAQQRMNESRMAWEQRQPSRDLAKTDLDHRLELERLQKQHELRMAEMSEQRKTTPARTYYRQKVGGQPWDWEMVTQMRDNSEAVTELPGPPAGNIQSRQFAAAQSLASQIAAERKVPVDDVILLEAWNKVQTQPLVNQQLSADWKTEQISQSKEMRSLRVRSARALISLHEQQLRQGQTEAANKTKADARADIKLLLEMAASRTPALTAGPGAREAAYNEVADELGIDLATLYRLMQDEPAQQGIPVRKPVATPMKPLAPPARPGGSEADQYLQNMGY